MSSKYEVIFVQTSPARIDVAYLGKERPNVKILTFSSGLKLEHLFLEAAKQAQGRYVVFANGPVNRNEIDSTLERLDRESLDVENGPGNHFIAVRKTAFLQAQSIQRTAILQKERRNNLFITQMANLALTASGLDKIFSFLNENRRLAENSIENYLNLTKEDDSNFYRHQFFKSLKGYLDSGLEFTAIPQTAAFYEGLAVERLTEVPWFLSILQSVWHLRHDEPDFAHRLPSSWEQKAVILVSVYNEMRFTELCFKAVRKFTNFPYRLIVVNNSTADMESFKAAVMQLGLIDEWFDSGCTSHGEGLQRALNKVRQFRYIVTLDCDAIVLKENWLTDLIAGLNQQNAALIGPRTFPTGTSIKGYLVHPSCMVIDQSLIGTKFQIDFRPTWPWDVGGLLTLDCVAHHINFVKVTHKVEKDYALGSSLINESVRHYWYTTRIHNLRDDETVDGVKVGLIREKLESAYNSPELNDIKAYSEQGCCKT